jgi:hypothetical protein
LTTVGKSTSGSVFFPLALTRGFTVTPGFFTVRLICQKTAGSIVIHDTAMTAMYFPG